MKIETKFDVGDKVYSIWHEAANGWVVLDDKFTVMAINVLFKDFYKYLLESPTWRRYVFNDVVFIDHEEAQIECDKRNDPLIQNEQAS